MCVTIRRVELDELDAFTHDFGLGTPGRVCEGIALHRLAITDIGYAWHLLLIAGFNQSSSGQATPGSVLQGTREHRDLLWSVKLCYVAAQRRPPPSPFAVGPSGGLAFIPLHHQVYMPARCVC